MENTKPLLQERIGSFIKANLLVLALFVGGVIFLGIGLIQFLPHDSNTIEFKKGESVEAASTSAVSSDILVDVSGEVKNPGVYSLPSSARVQDALQAAGGLSSNADVTFVAKSVNRASAVRDGMKIYIPRVGEVPVNAGVAVSQSTSEVGTGEVSGAVSINTASQSELESLSGIGPVTAGKIIAGRPYASIDELVDKKVVGQSVFSKIKDQISL